MRILVTAPSEPQLAPIAEGIFDELKNFCSEIEFVTVADFFSACSYFQKKITTFGIKNFERNYNENLLAYLETYCRNFKPDCILVLFGMNIPAPLQNFLKQYKIILWLWDSCKRWSALEKFTALADEIFCFEYEDINYLHEKYNISAKYLPLGANEKIYYPVECKRDIDISFIGAAYRYRIKILEQVCKLACKKNYLVKICGPFLDKRYFYKNFLFKLKNPHLKKFLDKYYCPPNEAAALYRRSKICLNINANEHRSLSPRTFEICATKSFQLMNSGQNSNGLMNLETDLVTFDGAEDLIEKIEFYLANDELREKIALAGYNSVMKNCTLKKSVERLLTESEIIRGLK